MTTMNSAVPVHADEGEGLSIGAAHLEIREILRILIERYRIVVAVGAAGLLLGVMLALVTTPRYRASALLQYDPGATDSLDQSRPGQVRAFVPNQEIMATQVGLLRSEALARRVAEDLDLADQPVYGGVLPSRDDRLHRATAMIEADTDAQVVKNSLLLRVTYSSTDPRLAARITSMLAQDFIALSLERRYNASSYARRFLSDQLAKTKSALEESERALEDYAGHARLFRIPGQVVDGRSSEGATLSVTDLTAMEDALNQARIHRIAAEAAWHAGASDKAPNNAGAVATLEQQRAALQAEYAQDLRLFKPDYPQMQQRAAEIAKLGDEISQANRLGMGEQGMQLAAAYHAALATETDLAARVAAAKGEVQSEGSRSVQYTILQREVDTNRELYDALLQRYKEVGVAGGIGQSTLSLVDDARVPQAPYRPNFMLNAVIGLIFGLMMGVAGAFGAHVVFDVLIDAADIRSRLRLPVLGIIPLEADGSGLSDALADRMSHITEAYYSALTAIKFSRPGGMPRSLFVTSSRPGEGKSTSAYALAVNSARLGRKVLLIDADLRRPTFASTRRYGLGFAHLLGSEDAVADYVQPTAIENLAVLPVGRYSDSAAELLSSLRLPAIIAEAVQDVDLVVIDGPPVLGLTDAPLLASVAEGTVIVIESRKTRTGDAIELLRRIQSSGGTLLGVLLTKTNRRGAGYGYYYYHRHEGSDHSAGAGKPRFEPGAALAPPQSGA